MKFTKKPLLIFSSLLMMSPFSVFADGSMNEAFNNTSSLTPNNQGITIFTAKRVITMANSPTEATAVAVRGKRIVGVGSVSQLKQQAGKTQVNVNNQFKDQIIMPGFIDQHLHPVLGALTLATEVISTEDWNLPDRTFKAANSQKEYMEKLVQAEKNLKDPNELLVTWGYHKLWHGPLDRAALDKISSTRPIIVWQRSCHEVYLNTAALKLLNINASDVENKGPASAMADYKAGHFWEQGLMNTPVMPKMLKAIATPERLSFGLKQMVAYTHANGVTAYNEPGAIVSPEMWQLYEKILGADDTPMYSTFFADGRGIVDAVGLDNALDKVEETIAIAPETSGKKIMFFPKGIKLFADGAIISQLMQMKEPYTDGHHGEWIIQPDELERRAKLFWDAGYQLHIHVNGDLGAEVVLATLEKRMKENPKLDHRFVVVHFANSNEQQIAQLAKNGAIFSVNPYYPVGFADKYAQGLGAERADMMVRSSSILKHTPHLSFHSDLPMAPSDPLYLAWSGVNRITPSGRVAGPSQKISVDAALRAITIEAAFSWKKEDWLGSIQPGKIANFTILEQDPYKVDPVKLKDIPISATIFEGRVFPVTKKSKPSTAPLSVQSTNYKIVNSAFDSDLLTHSHVDGDNCELGYISQQIALAYSENLKESIH